MILLTIFFHLLLLLLLLLLSQTISAFNLFPQYADVFTNNNSDSYFGYSLLLQAASTTTSARLIVGAPKDNSTSQLHKNLIEPGGIYACSLNGEICKQFLLNPNGNVADKTRNNIKYINKKDQGWLGCAIDGSDQSGGLFVACAPRWINQIHYPIYYLQNGICYYLQDSSNIEKKAEPLIPLIESGLQGYHRNNEAIYYYALGQAGMSVHITKNEKNILMGAPGVLQWQGMVINYYSENKSSELLYSKKEIPNPHFISEIEDFSYFGYAVSSGKFIKSSNQIWNVGGAPRAKNLHGQVLVYEYVKGKDDMRIQFEMSGRQAGEYFGATIAVGDINADGADDIFIGAPMFAPSPNKYDVGCVYFYLNNGQGSFNCIIINEPFQTSGVRFGSAISVIGDINQDGYLDVLIGAPYYNNNNGAIFLYLGTKNGINDRYSQMILSTEINSKLRGFGSSFSRGIDIDNNHYNDVAVGAYLSGHAVLIKTRPVVNIIPLLTTLKKQISLDTKYVQISACIRYIGVHLPNTLNIKIILNADPIYKRVYFNINNGTMWELNKQYFYQQMTCQNLNITIANTKSDFRQAIIIEMIHSLVENSENNLFCSSCPVVDQSKANKTVLNIPYEIGCGTDGICQTNLKLKAYFNYNKPYLIVGEEDSIDVHVKILNNGEPAFATKFYAEIPLITAFGKIPDICQMLKTNILLCNIGNPLSKNKTKILTFPIEVSMLNNNDRLIVKMNVTSLGTDIDMNDNNVTIEKQLKTQVEISVIGISDPEQFIFVEENNVLKHNNLIFTHNYTVQNLGPSPLDDLELTFFIPQRFKEYEENIIQVYRPEASLLKCTTNNIDGFYVDESTEIPLIEIDDPLLSEVTRMKRSSNVENIMSPNAALYSKVQKLIASDSEIPPDLPLNRTMSMNCPKLICMTIKCVPESTMKRSDIVSVHFKFLVNLTLIDEKRNEKDIVVLTSSVQPTSKYFQVNMTYTHTILQGSLRSENPLKWIVLGSILGIILLCAIIYGLYRAGFFRRQDHEKLLNEKEDQQFGEELNETSITE